MINIQEEVKAWGKEVKKQIIELGVTKKEFAEMVGVDYRNLCTTLSGTFVSFKVIERVNAFLEEKTEKVN